MELVLGYGAGLLTLINPCILPILPVVLAAAMQAGRAGPLALAGGMALSFVALGMAVTAAGHLVGLTPETVADAGAVVMIGFGLVLLVPRFSERFAAATAGLAARADGSLAGVESDRLGGQFGIGLLIGAVWSPCIGPTLGGAIALASQGESLGRAAAVMAAFALGAGTVMVGLAYGARAVVGARQAWLRRVAERSRPILGAVFVAVGAGLLLRVHHVLEYWAISAMPGWLIDLSVSL